MKKVFNTAMTAHVWAQNEQSDGRNSGRSLFFEGPTLYSYGYHFKVGEHRTAADGSAVVLLNADSYSTTTGRHKRHARRAIPAGVAVFTLPAGAWDDLTAAGVWYSDTLAKTLATAGRARTRIAWHYGEVARLVVSGNAYAAAFGAAWRLELPADVAAENQREARRANLTRCNRLRKTHAGYTAWRRGTRAACPRPWAAASAFDQLALSAGGDVVTTSGGASFPADHARRAAAVVLRMLDGRPASRGEHTYMPRLGHFTIDGVSNGVVFAGCHRVRAGEVRRLVRRLIA